MCHIRTPDFSMDQLGASVLCGEVRFDQSVSFEHYRDHVRVYAETCCATLAASLCAACLRGAILLQD
jgi:hypothetical protein